MVKSKRLFGSAPRPAPEVEPGPEGPVAPGVPMDHRSWCGPEVPVGVAQARLRELARDKTVPCPCCGRGAKIYWRAFNRGHAVCLAWLVATWRRSGGRWVYVPDAPPDVIKSREFDKLAAWGLAKTRDQRSTMGTRGLAGWWCPTPLGVEFAERRVKIPAHGEFWDNQVYRWDQELITIDQALPKGFRLDDIMGPAPRVN